MNESRASAGSLVLSGVAVDGLGEQGTSTASTPWPPLSLRNSLSVSVPPVSSQEGPADIDASTGKGEGDDGLDVLAAPGLLLQVVVAIGAFADDAGLGGRTEDAAKARRPASA